MKLGLSVDKVVMLCGAILLGVLSFSCGKSSEAGGVRTADADATAQTAEPPKEKVKPVAPAPEESAAPKVPSVAGVPDLEADAALRLEEADLEAGKDLNGQGLKKYKKKDYSGAIELFIKALERNPGSLLARYNLACTYALDGQKDQALGLLRQFQLQPNCPRCFIRLAKAVEDADFASIRDDVSFREITAGAVSRLDRALKEAHWISYDPGSLDAGTVVFEMDGLPAISEDGKRMAVAYSAEDGARRLSNLELQIFDVARSRIIRKQKLLNVKEAAKFQNGKITSKKLAGMLDRRIKAAHNWLLGTDWKELTVKTALDDPSVFCNEQPQKFDVGNSSITFEEPKLTVSNINGRSLFKGKVSGWSASRAGAKNRGCGNRAVLSGVHVSGVHHAMLFKVAYCTNPACETPDGMYRTIDLE